MTSSCPFSLYQRNANGWYMIWNLNPWRQNIATNHDSREWGCGRSSSIQLHLHSRVNTCFDGLGKDDCKTRRQTFKFWNLACLILEVWGTSNALTHFWSPWKFPTNQHNDHIQYYGYYTHQHNANQISVVWLHNFLYNPICVTGIDIQKTVPHVVI